MDILAALEGTAFNGGTRRCKIGRWLDGIDPTAPGRDSLVETMELTDPKAENYRPLDQLDALTGALGLDTSIKTIGDHRAKRCRCYR